MRHTPPSLSLLVFFTALSVSTGIHARPTRSRGMPPLEREGQLRPGVRHRYHQHGPFSYHVITIDLRTQGLEVIATNEEQVLPREHGGHRWMRTSTWARQNHADIAINANYYDLTKWSSSCGLTVSNGQRWQSTYDDRRLSCHHSIGFGALGRAEVFASRGLRRRGEIADWMQVVVSGSPGLLQDGRVVVTGHPRHGRFRNPRTAIGLSKDHNTLFLLSVEGREGHSQGMTAGETARTLLELGAWDALNLDGGGSSAMFIESEGGVVNRTGEPERPVVNHLGFRFTKVEPELPEYGPSDETVAQRAARERTVATTASTVSTVSPMRTTAGTAANSGAASAAASAVGERVPRRRAFDGGGWSSALFALGAASVLRRKSPAKK